MLILLIESSSMCVSINEAQNSQVLKQLSPVSCGWTNPVWINMAVHPNWKKEEYNSAGSGGAVSPPLPLLSCQKQGKWKHRELNPEVVHHALLYRFILCRLQGKDCYRRDCILKHCVRDEVKRINNLLSKISTPFLTYLIPFAIIKVEFWHIEYPQNYQTLLVQGLFFNL